MLTAILHDVQKFRTQIGTLKAKSPVYPEIFTEEYAGVIWASTIVEFTFRDIVFKRHHAESIVPNRGVTTNQLKAKLISQCELTIKHGAPCGFDEVKQTNKI